MRSAFKILATPLLFFALLFGCTGKKGYDPCKEWKTEMEEIRGIEKQLLKTEKKIQLVQGTRDTAGLQALMANRDALMESRRNAQIAAKNISYQCESWSLEPRPVNPEQSLEERKRKYGW